MSGHVDINDRNLMQFLGRLETCGRDGSPAMRAISQVFATDTEANFASESGPLGKWPALKNPTPRRKGGKILQDRGRLAASITPFHSADEAGIGTNVAYAAIHQNGGSIERAAYSMRVRHRTDAQGNLMRTQHFKGKGLVFAKDSHKRAVTRWFEVGEHTISIPARPYMPMANGQLQPRTQSAVVAVLRDFVGRN
jgi:phage gpG-like protein